MHNDFETLQKKCKSYHLKQKIKIAFPILILLLLITIFTYIFLFDNENIVNKEITKTKEIEQIIIKEIPKKIILKKPIIAEKVKEIKIIKPTKIIEQKNIIKDVEYKLNINSNYMPNKKTPTTKRKIIVEKKIKTIEPLDIPEKTPSIDKKTKNFSISVKELKSTKDLITQFNKDNNYDIALKIAQRYYDSKKYSLAILWTKKANVLNRKADSAWILYAKSEYARGNNTRAIDILNLYLANANSKAGEALLITWTQGK